MRDWNKRACAVMAFNAILLIANFYIARKLDTEAPGSVGHTVWTVSLCLVACVGWVLLSAGVEGTTSQKAKFAALCATPYCGGAIAWFIYSLNETNGWAAIGEFGISFVYLVVAVICFETVIVGNWLYAKVRNR